MKNIAVSVAASGKVIDLSIEAGTTVNDILRQTNLNGYELRRQGEVDPLPTHRSIYPDVEDGEKLLASTPHIVADSLRENSPLVVRRRVEALISQPKPDGVSRPVLRERIVVTPAQRFVVRHQPIPVVERTATSLLEERGWERRGGSYFGTYQTPFGNYLGRIVERQLGRTSFYITEPPACLWRHPHGLCFIPRGGNSYEVHFSQRGKTLDDGVIAVESILVDAHRKAS